MQITELHLLSNDLAGTEKFYSDVLKLTVGYTETGVLHVQAGQTLLAFHPVKDIKPYYHFAFTIHSQYIDEAFRYISSLAQIIPVSEEEVFADFSAWQARSFYFFDNNQNIVELIARKPVDEEIAPGKRSSVHCISEAGVVVSNVISAANDLCKKYSLQKFVRQPKHNEHFTVLGDDDGLLIVVPERRSWFPTDIPAQPFWTSMQIRVAGRAYEVAINDE